MASTEPVFGGDKLRKWLSENDKTQVWLAETLGVSQATVSAWLRGIAEPRASIAVKLERMTKIPVATWPRIRRAS